MFTFIAKHRGVWPISWMCEALGVSRSGFFAWLSWPPSARTKIDEILAAKYVRAFCKVTGPMARGASGMVCWPKGFPAYASDRTPDAYAGPQSAAPAAAFAQRPGRSTIVGNALDRQFEASAPNQKWVAYFTYIWTGEG